MTEPKTFPFEWLLDDPSFPWIAVFIPQNEEALAEAHVIQIGEEFGSLYHSKEIEYIIYLHPPAEDVAESILHSDHGISCVTDGIITIPEELYRHLQTERERVIMLRNQHYFHARDEKNSTSEGGERSSGTAPEIIRTVEWVTEALQPIPVPDVSPPISEKTVPIQDEVKVKEVLRKQRIAKRLLQEMLDRVDDEPFILGDDREVAKRTEVLMASSDANGLPIPSIYSLGLFWRYDHKLGIWQGIEKNEIKKLIARAWWQHPSVKANGEVAPMSMSDKKQNSVLATIQSETVDEEFFFISPHHGVGVRNGFLTIVKGEITLLPPSHKWRCNSYIDAEYEPGAKCPLWRKYLEEVMASVLDEDATPEEIEAAAEDSKKKEQLLAEFVGASLMGRTAKFQKCLVLSGEGGNGKSVFIDIITSLFDPSRVSSVPPQSWNDRWRPYAMVNAKVNLVSELPKKDFSESERFKEIVGGDQVDVERKFSDPIQTRITCGHIFSCNSLPHSNDNSSGFWRRFLLVKFNVEFENSPNKDPDLSTKILRDEIVGIAIWAMEGALALEKRNTFTIPKETAERLKEWKEASNPLMNFANAVIAPTNPLNTSMSPGELYKVYRGWCQENGHTGPLSSAKFGQEVKKYIKSKRTKVGFVYLGVLNYEYRQYIA